MECLLFLIFLILGYMAFGLAFFQVMLVIGIIVFVLYVVVQAANDL